MYNSRTLKGGLSLNKNYIFSCTSQPQSIFEIMPLWNIYIYIYIYIYRQLNSIL